jgi:ATP-binding cassette subfamily F protein 3
LLLDEPTNDLDIDSREALESVLCDYEGTIVVVSHDRYLLSRLCDRVLWVERGAWGLVDGGYDVYEAAQRERDKAAIDRAVQESTVRARGVERRTRWSKNAQSGAHHPMGSIATSARRNDGHVTSEN